ncbi:PLC-like phosphodiesterase [Crepidotus variabilis]|uniref:PLC-like phosphodiesterase n=1 Tax=Crepidotus variabilis TaxID=179855 RepID=A0A9P6EEU3_9AGAR|nr:PLC-like phosphodiesterase [Crepidotus variabilis]
MHTLPRLLPLILVIGTQLLEPMAQSTDSSVSSSHAYLAQQALKDIGDRAAPISGVDDGCVRYSKTCDWMGKFPGKTKLVHMNIPGTHDTATWNYSDATQASLIRYTGPIPPARMYRCQEHSILQSLNEGIRMFDLRVAYNPGNDTLGFHHSQALLAPTTRVEDVFFALYKWLDSHPTEAILASIKYEGGSGTPEDSAFYEKLYNVLNSPLAQKYWVQTNGTLGTLGEARGKLTLLRRFSWDKLPVGLEKRFDIPLTPDVWTDNGKNIELVYNAPLKQVAYIEDFYDASADIAKGSGTAAYIDAKFNATTAHLTQAATKNPDQLYINFASAAYISDTPEMTPQIFALGVDTTQGMNQRLLPWLQSHKGQRFGIILLDFYDAVPNLVEAVIGL